MFLAVVYMSGLLCLLNIVGALQCSTSVQTVTGQHLTCPTEEACVRKETTTATGKRSVWKGCGTAPASADKFCVIKAFCNDKDFCNADPNDSTVITTVQSRKCHCQGTPFLEEVSRINSTFISSEDPYPCNSKNECVMANIGIVATCATSRLLGQVYDHCAPFKSDIPSIISECYCRTDFCNDAENPKYENSAMNVGVAPGLNWIVIPFLSFLIAYFIE